jgi:hypothetical protein
LRTIREVLAGCSSDRAWKKGPPPGLVVALALGVVAHLPAVNNGFISDDYVILERVSTWVGHPAGFSLPPEGIRLTSYACFAFLKALVGLRAPGFYVFAILLHLLNITLLRALVLRIFRNDSAATAAGILFAVFQNPQEAVWWLSGMSDTLVAAFVLGSLVAWVNGRSALAALMAGGAVLSKDSGLALLVLIPLADLLDSGTLRLKKVLAWLIVPVALYAALFALNATSNSYLSSGLYAFGLHAIPVVVNTMHRLAFPWMYGAVVLLVAARRWTWRREWTLLVAWMVLTLVPYAFITFQNHVPSRSQYLASLGAMWLLAALSGRLPSRRLQTAFLAVFVAGNIAYLWAVKDRQYVGRAAPTEKLVAELRGLSPRTVRIEGFPFNPWVAKDTSFFVPGWRPAMIIVNEPGPPSALTLRWDAAEGHYVRVDGAQNAVPRHGSLGR